MQAVTIQAHCANPLPPDFGERRHELLADLEAAYAGLDRGRLSDRLVWKGALDAYIDYAKSEYRRVGLTASRLYERAFWRRLQRKTPSKDPDEHLWQLEAVLTDLHDDFWAHFDDQWADEANVQGRAAGPPGSGKSSVLQRIMEDWSARLEARGINAPFDLDNIEDHITIDPSAVPDMLVGKRPGQSILKDEKPRLAGQGSRTVDDVARNQAEQIRQSQVNVFEATPEMPAEDDAVTQWTLECRFKNRAQKWTLAFLHIEGQMHGVKAAPWSTQRCHDAYGPVKKRNVQRAMEAAHGDPDFLLNVMARCCEHPRFVKFLTSGKKPTKVDIKTALRFTPKRMMSGTDDTMVADFMFSVFTAWDRFARTEKPGEPCLLEAEFGIVPSDGMKKIGRMFYQQ